jgi:hypothetical protein
MNITRISMLTGQTHTRDLPVTQAQLDRYYKGDMLLQLAFPFLSADDREFIKTGITAEEWAMFAEEQEEEQRRIANGEPL